MNKKHTAQSAFFNLRILITLLLCAVAACSLVTRPLLAFFRPEASTKDSQRTLTFEERVSYQRAIEEVYWRHRIWPKERPDPKPSLDAVISQTQLERKVEDYLRNSQALEDYGKKSISADQLQTEMERMASHTKQPEVLRELFAALGNDPFVIAECLTRPVLAERLVADLLAQGKPRLLDSERNKELGRVFFTATISANAAYTLPKIRQGDPPCADTWTATTTINAPTGRSSFTAVWTGTEMIVWGGFDGVHPMLNTGGRYNASMDSWTATSISNVPTARDAHTAVWTGSEMIVWGGADGSFQLLNTGGRYNPVADTWVATSIVDAPSARGAHTAVWSGTEMIIWGGQGGDNTGGKYNPNTDSWTATSTTNAPTPRFAATAVWTGSKMIVWGGYDNTTYFNTGGNYDPSTDSWMPTSTSNAPAGREFHTAVWTGSEMIVWGGYASLNYLNTGGRYNPSTDSWIATSITNAPDVRDDHTAVWNESDSEMIVWGGFGNLGALNTGGRYNPGTNSWTATTTTNAPEARFFHEAVWADTEMILWGGAGQFNNLETGGRYCGQSSPTPTPTPTATPSPTSTPTPCTGRCTPTPRPRPTPAPRP